MHFFCFHDSITKKAKMSIMKSSFSKSVWGWALYDWANSAFATSVVAVFFPIFFKKFWAAELSPQESTFFLGTTLSVIALIFALTAPFLGTLSDSYGLSRRGLLLFATLGSLGCCLFFFIPSPLWPLALLVYGTTWFFFSGANLFYDSLMMDMGDAKKMNAISCFGFSLGYLGGGLLIIVNAYMVTYPWWFGLSDSTQAVKWVFLSVGIWWLIFTLPLALWVKDVEPQKNQKSLKKWFLGPLETLSKIRSHKNLMLFLVAYFFYIDGVHTIYKMAVDFALAINLQTNDLIKAIIIVQLVGFPATFLFSFLAKKTGTKNGIMIGLAVYSLVCVCGAFITTATHFYGLAVAIGSVQGGVQALSRSFFTEHIPRHQVSEFFGFYNMFGKFSAVLGPFLVGLTSLITQNSRISLFSILILFLIGAVLLSQVSEQKKET